MNLTTNWEEMMLRQNFTTHFWKCQKSQRKERNQYMSEKTKSWLKAAAVRAVKTMLPASAKIAAVDWRVVLGTAALAGVASLLTSFAGLPEVKQL